MVNRHPALRLLLVVSAWAFAMPGLAQTTATSMVETGDPDAPEPAHIAYIDGSAVVTREGRAETAAINVPLLSGDQLRTRDGRAEVIFGDGSVLDFDNFTTVDFLSDELVRLTEGRIRVTIGGRDRVSYRVDTPSGAVRIEWPGEYRISLRSENGRQDVELVAIRGVAALLNEQGETPVRAGERAFATTGMAPSYAQAYNSAAWDDFDRWAEDRRDERTGAASAQYLPDDVRGYAADFDRYGAWQYDVSYGYVWYPRVAVGWRPYYYGYWNYYNPWGWTWISYHPWGWPTHHYGRWGFRAGAWFWIPSHHWAPAYVYWAGASDYVGWCPLGWDNRPIFGINIGYAHYGYRGYDPYRAWTVVPRGAFGRHGDVSRYAVPRHQIDRAVPRWYVSGESAPIRPAAARRDVTPIYSAGRAVSRRASVSGSPVGPGRSGPAVSGAAAGAVNRDYAAPRGSRGGSMPTRGVQRATPPPAAGAIGPSTNWTRRPPYRVPGSQAGEQPMPPGERAVTRSRAPYRDAGPGGPEPRYQPNRIEDRAPYPRDYGRSRAEAPGAATGAPRGVPSGGIYGQRGVPRDDDRGYAPRAMPRGGVYAPSPQRAEPPSSYRPAPSRGAEGGSGVYAPRAPAAPRSYGPPPSAPRSYGPPPSAPPPSRGGPAASRPSGGDRGGDRAAPRGGGSSSSGGGHSRPRPQ